MTMILVAAMAVVEGQVTRTTPLVFQREEMVVSLAGVAGAVVPLLVEMRLDMVVREEAAKSGYGRIR